MKIGIIQASSQKDKNSIMETCVREVIPKEHEVINFGIFGEDARTMSYIQIAICTGLLLESDAVDFMITGCSSGQGMMLACNSLPGVLCGYVQNPTDAYLFGRINNGNAISYPLGFNWGWAGEINFRETIRALFGEPFGNGYPAQDAERKRRDSAQLKEMNQLCKKSFVDIWESLDKENLLAALHYDVVRQYIMKNGKNTKLLEQMKIYG